MHAPRGLIIAVLPLRIVLCILAVWKEQATSGEKLPGLWGHSLTMIDTHRALLFGGSDGREAYNDAYILDMDTWVCKRLYTKGGSGCKLCSNVCVCTV